MHHTIFLDPRPPATVNSIPTEVVDVLPLSAAGGFSLMLLPCIAGNEGSGSPFGRSGFVVGRQTFLPSASYN